MDLQQALFKSTNCINLNCVVGKSNDIYAARSFSQLIVHAVRVIRATVKEGLSGAMSANLIK